MVGLRQKTVMAAVRTAFALTLVQMDIWAQAPVVDSSDALTNSGINSPLAPVVDGNSPPWTLQETAKSHGDWAIDPTGSSPFLVRLAQAAEPPAEPATAPPVESAPPELTSSATTPPAASPSSETGRPGTLTTAALFGIQSLLQTSSETPFIQANKKDAATLLEGIPGITLEPRAQPVHDTILRGRRLGQVLAKGSYWFPARQDLDTALSKIDSRVVDEIRVLKGPYSAMYGPGLSFYDVRLLDAPRQECCCGDYFSSGLSLLEYETNGQQWHGRQGFWGGADDWGFRVGYSHRTGSDYDTGAGNNLPSSYKSRQLDVALGADLTSDSKIDFRYLRMDQTDVEFPTQYFDINVLVTDAYEVTLVLENEAWADRIDVDGWYNETSFNGDNLRPGKRSLLPLLDAARVVGFTDVDAFSTGFRGAMEWGDSDTGVVTAGTDLRYLGQRLEETNSFAGFPAVSQPIPPSHSSNPGIFLELDLPLSDRSSVRTGGRLDWVSMNADGLVDGINVSERLGGDLDQDFFLGSAFITFDHLIRPQHTLNVGVGYAMRPPTMTDMYALGPFIAVLPQNIGTSLFGNPLLNPERMWQLDAGISSDYGHWRTGLSGFYSWVEDYITYDFLGGGLIYSPVNTPRATLSGFEMYAERDIGSTLTAFGTISFVEARDHTRLSTISRRREILAASSQRSQELDIFGNVVGPTSTVDEEPLPVIGPLASNVGLRWQPPEQNPKWAFEFTSRIVDVQDRVATSLGELITPGFTTFDVTGFLRPRDNLLITAGVLNVTDKLYRTHFDTRRFGSSQINTVFRPGISFYLGTELTY